MRICLVLPFVALLPVSVAAQPGPIPGTQLVQPVFDEADLVCSCRVESARIVTLPSASPDKDPRSVVRVTASVQDSYKSAVRPSSPLVFEYPKDPMSENPGVTAGSEVLLFLRGPTAGVYRLANPFIGLTTFSALVQVRDKTGLGKLQSALATALQQGNRYDEISGMRLLEGFTRLDPNTITIVSALSASSDDEIAFSALAVLVKTGTPDSVARLFRYLDSYHENQPPLGLLSAAGELSLVTDPEALPDIERLSGSRFLSIQIAAMDAIRLIASAKSAPTLIQRLDDPNRNVQYSAMITLAEIFGARDGEPTPGMELFDKKPEYYKSLWKRWWADQGNRLNGSAAGRN